MQAGNTALTLAAYFGFTEVVQALLAKEGISINAVNKVGHVLMSALQNQTVYHHLTPCP